MINTIMQIISTIALGTLAMVMLTLATEKFRIVRIATAKHIYLWCGLVLLTVFIGRFLTIYNIISTYDIRSVNSTVFILAVVGIIWSVVRHRG